MNVLVVHIRLFRSLIVRVFSGFSGEMSKVWFYLETVLFFFFLPVNDFAWINFFSSSSIFFLLFYVIEVCKGIPTVALFHYRL